MLTITASASELLHQAKGTAGDYLDAAVRHIDETFGDGYAKKHPELVAAWMKVASEDFVTSITLKISEQLGEGLLEQLWRGSGGPRATRRVDGGDLRPTVFVIK